MDDKAFDVLTANERDMLAEALAVEFGQAMPMAVLFGGHFFEEVGGGRKIGAKRVSEIAIDMAVFFLGGNSESEDLSLVQPAEFHLVFRHKRKSTTNEHELTRILT